MVPEIARFFYGVGITVYEGYGLSEAGPVVSCNIPGYTRLGTVGRPLPKLKSKLLMMVKSAHVVPTS